MEHVRITCPNCSSAYDVEASCTERKLQCEVCETKFYVEVTDDGSPVTRPAVVCPSCGTPYAVPVEHMGRQAKCAECGAEFTMAFSTLAAG